MQQFLGVVNLEDGSQAAVKFRCAAVTAQQAVDEYNRAHPGREMSRARALRGGTREGAGRKAKYCEVGKTVRVPETIANNIDEFLPSVIDLYHLCLEYQQMASDSPTSPRYDKVREFLKNAQPCLEALKKGIEAAIGG